MASHYQRIYSAKPKVDTNLSRKSGKPLQHPPNIICCTPEAVLWAPYKSKKKNKEFGQKNSTGSNYSSKKPFKINMQRNSAQDCTFRPQILETNAQSKLKSSLDVYYPPKKRSSTYIPDLKTAKGDDCPGLSMMDMVQEGSPNTAKPSSLDSAYTEGLEDQWSEDQLTPYKTPETNNLIPRNKFSPQDPQSLNFLREITDEILEKGIYSNYGLKQLFKEHMKRNKYNLCRKIMESALHELQIALEIPIDDKLNDVDFGLGDGTSFLNNFLRSTNSKPPSLSDNNVLSALESLDLDPGLKEDVIISLGLTSSQETSHKCSSKSSLSNIIDRKSSELIHNNSVNVSEKGSSCNKSSNTDNIRTHSVSEKSASRKSKVDILSERNSIPDGSGNSGRRKAGSPQSSPISSIKTAKTDDTDRNVSLLSSCATNKSKNDEHKSNSSSLSSIVFD